MKYKTGRKILIVLLTVVMVIGLLPVTSMTAYAAYSYPLPDGCNYTTSYNTDGTIQSITCNFQYLDQDWKIADNDNSHREFNILFTTDAGKVNCSKDVVNGYTHEGEWNAIATQRFGINNSDQIWSGISSSAYYVKKTALRISSIFRAKCRWLLHFCRRQHHNHKC